MIVENCDTNNIIENENNKNHDRKEKKTKKILKIKNKA